MSVYYNEFDPFAAQWLRELIQAGMIAPGVVDSRSISDVKSDDLAGVRQCHFFAGIGVWSYALRKSGWPDDRPVWTGSCPCQPFSAAGKGKGTKDERHLWPELYRLIAECRPVIAFGEQVASKDGLAWLDVVQANLEDADYTVGAIDTCSAGFGAPHIRQRLYWVAHANHARLEGRLGMPERADQCATWPSGLAGGLADTMPTGRPEGWSGSGIGSTSGGGGISGLAYPDGRQRDRVAGGERRQPDGSQAGWIEGDGVAERGVQIERPGPTNGFWRAADWIGCTDGKWRPIKSGIAPLAHGATARVGRLRGYGNAINAEQAAAFIEAVMEEA